MEDALCEQSVSEFQSHVATWVEHRTAGLVRNARVELIEGRLIVHGSTESEHVREVATLTLAVLLGEIRANRLDIRVERVEVMQPASDHPYCKEVPDDSVSHCTGSPRPELSA